MILKLPVNLSTACCYTHELYIQVEPGVSASAISSFTVDASGAGPGDLKVSIKDDKNKQIPVEIRSEYNNTYTVEYTAPTPGVYTIDVTYGGKKPSGYPLVLPVSPPSDLSRVRVIGLEKGELSR